MKIEILRGTICGGDRVDVGDVVEASNQDAKLLIDMGKAKKVEAVKKNPLTKTKRKPMIK